MSGYITFKKFVTPGFIIIIWILGALAVTIVSIILMAGGFNNTAQGGTVTLTGDAGIIVGILVLIFGNLFWRITCEYMVVQFRIYDELVSLNRTGIPTPSTTQAPSPSSGAPICPSCGGPLRYIQQYQRWYCDKEQKYV